MIINENVDDSPEDNKASPTVVTLKVNNDTQSGLTYYSLPAELLILCQNEIDINTLHITNQNPFVIDGQMYEKFTHIISSNSNMNTQCR